MASTQGFGPTITLCTYRPGTRDSMTDLRWPMETGSQQLSPMPCHITMGVGTRREGSGSGGWRSPRAPSAREAASATSAATSARRIACAGAI